MGFMVGSRFKVQEYELGHARRMGYPEGRLRKVSTSFCVRLHGICRVNRILGAKGPSSFSISCLAQYLTV